MIRMIVGRCHVSETDEAVCLYLISQLRRGAWDRMDKDRQHEIARAACEAHEENRRLYVDVMSGGY